MRKSKIVLYIGLLAIIIGGAPYFTGYLVETKFQDVVRVISDMDSAQVVIIKYQRGWRTSFAQTRVTFTGPYTQTFVDSLHGVDASQKDALKEAGFSILLNYDIRHGPFVQVKDGDWRDWRFALATFHSQVFLTEHAKETLEKLIGQSKLVDINGEMTIEGAVNVAFEGTSWKWQEGDEGTFIWKGMQGSWNLSQDMKHFQSEVVFPGMALQADGKSIAVDDIIVRNDQNKSADGLWLGKITAGVQKLAFADSKDPTQNGNFVSVSLGSLSHSESGLVDGSGTLTIEQIRLADKEFGPFNLVLSIKNINVAVVKAAVEISKNMSDRQAQAAFVQKISMLLPELLKNRPIFSIDNFSLNTTDGELKANLNVAVGGADASDINNMQQIINSIVAKASAMLPKAILQDILTQQYTKNAQTANALAAQSNQKQLTDDEIKQQVATQVQDSIATAVKEGYLIENGNLYKTEMEFSQSQLKVNGKPMALPQNPSVVAPPTNQPRPASPLPGATSAVQ